MMESTQNSMAIFGDSMFTLEEEVHRLTELMLNPPTGVPPPDVTGPTAAFVAATNSPINLVGRPAFRDFAHVLNPQIQLPSPREVREEIVAQADHFRENFPPDMAGGLYISLMIDGSSMARRKWLAVCIACANAFYFWRVLELTDNAAETIAFALRGVVEELCGKGFVVCGVVTDNAANEIAAVPRLSALTGRALIRIPCMSHTLNLAVHDFFTTVFGPGVFESDLHTICLALRSGSGGGHFHGVSFPCPTRWLSYGELVERIVGDYANALRLIHESGRDCPAFWRYNFPELNACFRVVNGLMTWTESQHSFLNGVWFAAVEALGQLTALQSQGNSYALRFRWAIQVRLERTANLGQLILGYVTTERGLAWYRGLPSTGQPNTFNQVIARQRIEPFLAHFVNLFHADRDRFMRAFNEYLSHADWPPQQHAVQFWNVVATYSPTCFSDEQASYRLIATMALILMRMPCSEAEVERVFSVMRGIIGKRSIRTKQDLLESRLILQMNGLGIPSGRLAALDSLEKQDDTSPDEGQMTPPVAWGSARPEFPIPLIFHPHRPRQSDDSDVLVAPVLL
jgi:hypothetical protein